MSMVVTCRCGQKLKAPPNLAGKRVSCPVCRQPIQVPQAAAPATPAPAAARPAARPSGETIVVACSCGQQFAAEPYLAGRQVPCPVCGQTLLVPAAAGAPAHPFAGGPLDDPLGVDLGALVAAAPAAPSGLAAAPAPYARRKPQASFNARPVIIGGVVFAVVVLVLGVGYGLYQGIRSIANSFSDRWEEYTSTGGRYAILLPRGGLSRIVTQERPVEGTAAKEKVEFVQFPDGRQVGVSYADLPVAVPEEAVGLLTQAMRAKGKRVIQERDVTVVGHPAKEIEYENAGLTLLSRFLLVRGRLYEIGWAARPGKLDREGAEKFFNSFRLLDAPTSAAPASASPAGTAAAGGKPAPAATVADYATARRSFQTKLTRRGPPPQPAEPLRTPPGATRIDYTSGGMKLAAFVSAAPADGTKRPAVLFLHGGFGFGVEDWDMAAPYRDAGYIVMIPALRAENGQPGSFTLYFEEVDDVLAAAEALAAQPGVDAQRLFVAGHSAGGSLATLAAMAAKRFRAAAALSGCMDQRLMADIAPFDPQDEGEFRIRSPRDFATCFQCPARLYYGSAEDALQASTTNAVATQAKQRGLDVEAVSVPGDHFNMAAPGIRQSLTFFQQHGGADPAKAAKSPSQPTTPTPGPAPTPAPYPAMPGLPTTPFPPTPQPPAPLPSPPPMPTRPPGFPQPPRVPGVPHMPGSTPAPQPGRGGLAGSVVVFHVLAYNGSREATAAAQEALAGIPWADLSRLEYNAGTHMLRVGLRGSAVDTGPAKAALEKAGFRIGATSIRRR